MVSLVKSRVKLSIISHPLSEIRVKLSEAAPYGIFKAFNAHVIAPSF
jgi:hypothetical protein